jgi:molecular chaperone DnaJ
MTERSFYEILGVARDADEKALKSAFRKKAMEFHPDRNPGCATSEAKFKEVNEAYEALSDPQKRAVYDRFGKAGLNGAGGPGAGGRQEDILRDVFGDFGDVFSEFFGASRRHAAPSRGADLRYDCEISLEEAYFGKAQEINVPTLERCEPCSGSGAEPGSTPETCAACNGVGRVAMTQGFFTMERTCGRCQGKGVLIKSPCKTCGGRGAGRRDRKLVVNIPAGILHEQKIRLTGEGEPSLRGGQRGDLYVFVNVRPHDIFERDEQDLYARAPLPMSTAALGGEIEMPTIDGGRVKVAIPEGAQTGARMRLKGKGMPNVRGGPLGDLYVELFVETPRNLTARQKELLKEFNAACSEKSHPESHGFFNKVKRFFEQDHERRPDGRQQG